MEKLISRFIALQTMPAGEAESTTDIAQCLGFSLHASLEVEADQRAQLERLARYLSRPPVASSALLWFRS
jgi:hypothetical protein